MENFFYYNPTKLVFGQDSVGELAGLLGLSHKKVLLVYGGGSIKTSGLYDDVVKILKDKDIEITELSGIEPNPKLGSVQEGIRLSRENDISLILAVGGGSVIDAAKAIAVGVPYEGDVWDFFEGKANIKEALPLGVILTIPATGSESSSSSVVTKEEGELKKSIGSDLIRPEFAILNPQLTLSLPEKQTFAGIMDIISHILERYFTHTEDVDLTDNLCEASLRSIIRNAYKLKENQNDYGARAEIMLAGTMAHSGILGLGREEDWASHRIGHEITGLYETTHGVTLAMVFPGWMKYVYKENIDRFVRFAVEVFGVNHEGKSSDEVALKGIKRFEGFLKDIGMPLTFEEAKLPIDKFQLMAEKCTFDGPVGFFKKLNKEDVEGILELIR